MILFRKINLSYFFPHRGLLFNHNLTSFAHVIFKLYTFGSVTAFKLQKLTSPVSLLGGRTKPRHVQGHNVFVCNMNAGILNQVF